MKTIIHEAEAAIVDMVESNDSPSGLIRLSGSLMGGQRLLMPHVWTFMEKYPNVQVEMLFTDDIVDVIKDGIDFTLRMGDLDDSELLVRRMGKGERVIVASPTFIQEHLVPHNIQDLKKLPAILTSPDRNIWRFASGESVSVTWKLSAGAIPVAVEGARRGFGMALVPFCYCEHYLQSGQLVQLLSDESLPAADISLVYPRLRHQSPAAKAFLAEMKNAEI